MNGPTPLTDRLETTRQVVLLVNRIGVEGTKSIVDAGLGALSSNVAITVLSQLAGNGPLRPRDLLGPTQLTRGGLSNLLDRLETAGSIVRTYGSVPGDRRGATMSLTENGHVAATTIGDVLASTLQQLGDVVSELTSALGSITGEPRGLPSGTIGNPTGAGPLSVAGAALGKALTDVDPDDPTPIATALTLCGAVQPGHIRPRELIEVTGLSSSSVSHLLDRLEHDGLVQRRTGQPPDRRAVLVTLTDEGRRQLEHRLDAIAEHLALLRSAVPGRARS